jgi:hypothetical protein
VTIIPFPQLEGADLVVDAVYEGNDSGNLADDPIARLLKGGNAGNFRYCGSIADLRYLIVCSLKEDTDWQDIVDVESGTFICYGDNRKPGHDLHDTPKNENVILRNIFNCLHRHPNPRVGTPPVFLFSKHPTPNSPRSVQFRGVCAPGALHLNREEALISVWRITDAQRFQNYQATFTILDIPVVSRKWIAALESGQTDSNPAPVVWNMWLKSGLYRPLQAKHTAHVRSIAEQLPHEDPKKALLFKLYRYFNAAPGRFEYFAADIYRMSDSRVIVEGVTRNTVDGGYEVSGRYRLGLAADPIHLKFTLEGKCYNPGFGQRKRKSVGIKETSRLISRLKSRRIGVLVTTSVVAEQAYQETRAEKHPMIFLCGSDIVDILYGRGINTVKALEAWLSENYPA